MFPKKGNYFPNGTGAGKGKVSYAAAIAAALRAELGDSHQAVKTNTMRWTGANERTVKNWLAGKWGPSWRALAWYYSALEYSLGSAGSVSRSTADHCRAGALRCP